MNSDNLKYQKLLWSIVIVATITFFVAIIYNRSNVGPGAPVAFLLVWPVLIVISPVIISLRLLRIAIKRYSFVYILIGVINVYAGVLGLYLGWMSTDKGGYWLYTSRFGWCILLAGFILWDVFIKGIKEVRKVEKV